MPPKVVIIILSWNGWRDTIECLESLFKIDYPNYSVVIVDNGSTDDSVRKMKEWGHGRLEVVALKENLGFARGNNVGIKYALERFDPEYFLILNNDTTVARDFLGRLVETLEEDPKNALAAPRVLDYYSGGFWQKPTPWRLNVFTYLIWATQLFRFFSRFIRLSSTKPSRIYVAPGCCLLLKRDAFGAIDYFDENTFLGWEEFIIAEKLFRAGYASFFVPQSVIRHKIGRDTDRIGSLEKIRIFTASEAYFQEKILGLGLFQRLTIRLFRAVIYSFMLIVGEKRFADFFAFMGMLLGGHLWSRNEKERSVN